MKRAIYPGSFDPCTLGHLDIIKRAANMVDELVVGVLINKAKTPLFSPEYRVSMLKEVTKDIPNVKVESFEGLLADFARQKDANIIVRGLRIVTDFEFELQVAQTNRMLNSDLETIFLTTSLEYSYLSSTTVRETAAFGGDISKFVPPELVDTINEKVAAKFKEDKNE
ncbi:MAG: pantetheine-phosphate adenylyltransferase [Eubacterium sp.]|nr:pantetheine-phosphate adenylyltransferase [Eubacterium sp.]